MGLDGSVMFAFRRLSRDDFGLLADWLAQPHVHEWWDHEYTLDALERDFGRAIDRDEPAEDFFVLLDGAPIGIVQYSHFVDYPEHLEEMAGLTRRRGPTVALTVSRGPGAAARRLQ